MRMRHERVLPIKLGGPGIDIAAAVIVDYNLICHALGLGEGGVDLGDDTRAFEVLHDDGELRAVLQWALACVRLRLGRGAALRARRGAAAAGPPQGSVERGHARGGRPGRGCSTCLRCLRFVHRATQPLGGARTGCGRTDPHAPTSRVKARGHVALHPRVALVGAHRTRIKHPHLENRAPPDHDRPAGHQGLHKAERRPCNLGGDGLRERAHLTRPGFEPGAGSQRAERGHRIEERHPALKPREVYHTSRPHQRQNLGIAHANDPLVGPRRPDFAAAPNNEVVAPWEYRRPLFELVGVERALEAGFDECDHFRIRGERLNELLNCLGAGGVDQEDRDRRLVLVWILA
mmetsp:Transcript_39141/g.124591  ORF Transcript_39141/g.124591 Transcript_39141/m.124591 type:complete len:347 (-) Transcript_39141:695-1735(-)